MTLRRQCGFTLVELLLAMGMLSITLGAFYAVYRVQTRTLKSQDDRLEAQQTARVALDFMVREMRNAGYNPANTTSGNNCGDGVAGTPGIIAASATTFHFSYDSDGDGNCSSAGENIKYDFNAGNVTRAVDGGAAEPITDGNSNNLQFIYYPQQTTGAVPPPYCSSSSPSTPSGCVDSLAANIANVKRVSIQVTVQSKNANDDFGGGQMIATLTSNVDLRNR